MRMPTIRSTSRIAVIILVTIVGVHSLCALAQSQPHPLAPPDLSSPRATLTNFLKLMDTAYHYWKSEGRTYENRGQRAAIGRLAQRFCDLNDIAFRHRISGCALVADRVARWKRVGRRRCVRAAVKPCRSSRRRLMVYASELTLCCRHT